MITYVCLVTLLANNFLSMSTVRAQQMLNEPFVPIPSSVAVLKKDESTVPIFKFLGDKVTQNKHTHVQHLPRCTRHAKYDGKIRHHAQLPFKPDG